MTFTQQQKQTNESFRDETTRKSFAFTDLDPKLSMH